MCNDFGNRIPYDDYLGAFSQTRIPVKWPTAAPNLEPRDDIWPTDPAPVIRRLEDGTNEFRVIRWGFPPAGPKGRSSMGYFASETTNRRHAYRQLTTRPRERIEEVLPQFEFRLWLECRRWLMRAPMAKMHRFRPFTPAL